MNSVDFQTSVEDLTAAYRLNLLSTVKTKRVARTYIIGGAVSAGIAALVVALWDPSTNAMIPALAGFAYWVLFFSAIILAAYLRVPRQARRILAQQKSLQDRTIVEWSVTEISFSSTRGFSRFAWSDFTKIVEGTDVLILRQSDAIMNFIPSRVLSLEQVRSLRMCAGVSSGIKS